MTWYSRGDYGSHNPNAGKPANGNTGAWGGYEWDHCPPSSMNGTTDYTSKFGQRLQVTCRKEVVELMTLMFRIADKHDYLLYANKDGENWGPWGAQCRAVSGTSTPSGHSKNLSMDWNAPYNPYSYTFQSDMPPAMVADIENCGWYWGGRYEGQKYDAMHYGYCWTPADVAGHVARANSILGGSVNPPIPPGVTMPMITMRTPDGVDWFWTEDLRVIVKCPTADYYHFFASAKLTDVPHGEATPCEQNLVDWVKAQVQGSGGIIWEPTG